MTTELTTPYEYLFFFLSAAVLAYVHGQKLLGVPDLVLVKKRGLVSDALMGAALLLLAVGATMLLLAPTIENADYLFAGGICLAGSLVFRNLLPTSLPHRGRSAPPRH